MWGAYIAVLKHTGTLSFSLGTQGGFLPFRCTNGHFYCGGQKGYYLGGIKGTLLLCMGHNGGHYCYVGIKKRDTLAV